MSSIFGQTAGEDWLQLGTDYFHKVSLFPTQWPFTVPSLQSGSFSLNGVITVAADNGGPVFIVRDSSDKAAPDFRKKLRVFTSSGVLLTEFQWDHNDVIAYGWTYQERIAAVTSDGTVYTYNIHGKRLSETLIDDKDGTDFIQIATANISRFGIACTFSTLPGKVAFFSFANDTTVFYPTLPSNLTITSLSQVVPSVTHVADNTYTNSLVDEEDEFLLSDLNNEQRYRLYPRLVVCGHYSSPSRPGPNPTSPTNNETSSSTTATVTSTSLFELTPTTITETEDIVPTVINTINVDSSQQFVALWSDDSKVVYCFSLKTKQVLYQFKSQSKRIPQTILFVGSASLLQPSLDPIITGRDDSTEPAPKLFLHWNINNKSVAMIVGNNNQFRSYNWPSSTIVCQEPDYSVRVICETSCDLVQCLHPDIVDTLSKNSTSPSTQLLSSYLQFKPNHLPSDIILRRLIDSGQLPQAIKCVLSAACHSVHEPTQTLLLQVCSFGRTHVSHDDDISSDFFVDSCTLARLLHNIRTSELGMALTYTLLTEYYTPELLILRMTTYHQHELAVKMCIMLKIPADLVIRDWCFSKLLLSSDDSSNRFNDKRPKTQPATRRGRQLARYLSLLTPTQRLVFSISDKLRLCNTRSYVQLSLWAAKYNQMAVSIALSFCEPLLTNQTALFLSFGEHNSALRSAYLSGDYELLIVTITRMYDTIQPTASFYRLIHMYPDIELIWVRYILKNQWDLFCEYCQSIPNPSLSTAYFIAMSLYQLQVANDSANQVVSNFKQLTKDASNDKNGIVASGYGQFISEHDMLMQIQQKYIISGQLPDDSLGLSLVETIRVLYSTGQDPLVNVLKDVFKLTDRRLSYIHIQVLVGREDWSGLQAKSTQYAKVMGGYEFIIEALVEAKATQQAIRYIDLLPKSPQILDWLCRLGLDVEGLRQLRAMCSNQQQQAVIDKLIQEMTR